MTTKAATTATRHLPKRASPGKRKTPPEVQDNDPSAPESTVEARQPPIPSSAAVIRRVSPRAKKVKSSAQKLGDVEDAACAPVPKPAVAQRGTKLNAGKEKAASNDPAKKAKKVNGKSAKKSARRGRRRSSTAARINGATSSPDLSSSPSPSTRSTRARPRWHNANYLLFLALRQHPQKAVPRTELILAALALDEKISKDKGLPKVFNGKTPVNTASSTLTCNTDKLFVSFRPEGSRSMWFRLAFEPADFDSAIAAYNSWMCRLVEHDWPLCFGRRILLLDDARTRAMPGLEELLEKWEVEFRQQNKVENSQNLLPRGTPSGPLRYETRARIAGSPGSDKENKEDEEEEEQDADKSVATSDTPSMTPATQRPLRAANPDLLPDGENSLPKGDPRNHISPFPEGLDLIREPKAEVVRLSPKVVEVFIPELSPPTDWRQVLRVGPSTILGAGDGLFAKRPIPLGVPLGFYFGIPMTEDEFDSLKDGVGVASDYSIMYRRTVLDATDTKGMPFRDPAGPVYCPFHFMNEDVERRNVTFTEGVVVNQVIVFTTRAIEAGEELFVDYGKDVNRHWTLAKWEIKG